MPFFSSGKSSKDTQSGRTAVTRTVRKTLPNGTVVTETITEYSEQTEGAAVSKDLSKGFKDFKTAFSTSKTSTSTFSTSKGPGNSKSIKPSASSSSSSSSEGEDEEGPKDFQKAALARHNEYRAKHGCPALALDTKLTKYAQEWANKLAKENKFEHRKSMDYGENIYSSWSSNPKAKCSGPTPVDSWYSEISKHHFGKEPTSMGTGHFTQVVWKGSRKLGIAKARSTDGKIIVVANYEPAGNFLGRYVENVPPPK